MLRDRREQAGRASTGPLIEISGKLEDAARLHRLARLQRGR